MEAMHCRKCGAPARIENGQKWDQQTRKYQTCFRVCCWRCGERGPVLPDTSEAVKAWNAQQTQTGGDVG